MSVTRTLDEQNKIERDFFMGKTKNVPNTSKSLKELQEEHLDRQNKQDAHFDRRAVKAREESGVKAETVTRLVVPGVTAQVKIEPSDAPTNRIIAKATDEDATGEPAKTGDAAAGTVATTANAVNNVPNAKTAPVAPKTPTPPSGARGTKS